MSQPITRQDIENAASSLFITNGGQEGDRLAVYTADGMVDCITGFKTLADVVCILCLHLGIKESQS